MITRRKDGTGPRHKSAAACVLLLAATLLNITLSACTQEKKAPEPAPEAYELNITIGLSPEQNIFKQLERYRPVAEYLSRKTGISIEMKILSRYGNVINNFNMLKLDGAFFGSLGYALAQRKIGVEAIVRPENQEGVSSYYGMIFVRKDSGIRNAAQMKGKRFAFVDKATTAGYLLPLKYFRENGIDDYGSYFSETYFTGTHEDAIYDVLKGEADIGAAKNTIYYRLASEDSRITDELMVLARSPDVPENALALRNDLDEWAKSILKKTFLEMDADPEGRRVLEKFGAARFIETTDEDYAPVFNYADSIGLDLFTYDWMND